MIFDEQDLVKTLNKADNFTAMGLALGATPATAAILKFTKEQI